MSDTETDKMCPFPFCLKVNMFNRNRDGLLVIRGYQIKDTYHDIQLHKTGLIIHSQIMITCHLTNSAGTNISDFLQ